ncbi:DNA-directed RNA polymerase subunit beta', partial [Prevotella sp.]|uniref:DNA-directed RNA polymerase subunit beta' n=1 Tax=Prevotella sp. TaxID=59823 RepID=UPI003AB99646
MAFKKDSKIKSNFTKITIGLASPEEILENSFGEVTKPETINYRTYKPERDGLFCERIFGPTKDYECACGKYKRIRYKGIVCDRCGVEVTEKKVRRERTGHIELVVPVAHIWYFRSLPNKIGYLLGLPTKKLDAVVYYEKYIVIQPGIMAGKIDPEKEGQELNGSHKMDLLSEDEYLNIIDKLPEDNEYLEDTDPSKFIAKMGAEAIYDLLVNIDLDGLSYELRDRANSDSSQQRKTEALKRLQVVEAFRGSRGINKPEWMIMKIIPVTPPELRPLVPLDGGRFATSDLNDLYRRVIIRNNRLKRLIEIKAPEVILRNEKRMLQEAVDSLFDNSRKSSAVKSESNRPLKSLSDSLKGKAGRFRQNLLGKRVDYSARSVIVVGPELKMGECGLPKLMAAELYKPFIIRKLIERGIVKTVKSAKKIVDRREPVIWDILENVMKGHPVLLNRAPTLHRLGIQAFQPKLIEGKAIQLHPLACTAFNADFDGDQMAVHLPLSAEAQAEARVLMMSVNNILAPKDGKPITVPTQDMVLGAYYLTIFREGAKGEGRRFISFDEARLAYFNKDIALQAKIKVRVPNSEIYPEPSDVGESLVTTSMGNIIYNCELPLEMRYYSKQEDGTWLLGKLIDKKELGRLVAKAHKLYGNFGTARVLDTVKKLGYDNACLSGLSIAASDIEIPKEKGEILAAAEKEVDKVERLFSRGLMSEDERYRKVIDIWNKATEDVADALMKNTMDQFNPLFMMANSGARGNVQQIRQLAGMRGLMADPSGRIIDRPIKSNFREGLTVLEYFISTHGARKGLADTALRTADSGYLTRRLVDVAQDVIVREDDCDVTTMNLVRERARFCKNVLGSSQRKLKEYAVGRTLASSVLADDDSIIAEADTVVTEDVFDRLLAAKVLEIRLYPLDEENGEDAETLAINVSEDKVKTAFREHMTHHFLDKEVAEDILDGEGTVLAHKGDHFTAELIETILDNGTVKELSIRNNEVDGIYVEAITAGKNKSTVLESLRDRLVGRTLAEEIEDKDGHVLYHINDYITEDMADVIASLREKVKIRSVLTCKSHFGVCRKCYGRNLATARKVEIGEAVGTIAAQAIGEPGTQLTMRTFHTGGVAGADDITQGLPRVEELFEARKPKHPGILSESAGTVSVQEKEDGRFVIITREDGTEDSYHIPYGAKLHIADGDHVEVGDRLTEGSLNPHDILRISGPAATRHYLVQQVLSVYKSQGVEINDKHVEVMV